MTYHAKGKTMRKLLVLLATLTAALAFVAVAHAGQITGRVTVYDYYGQGAPIPNVQIKYFNVCTGAVGATRSNGSGFYSFTTSNGCAFSLTHYAGDGWAYWSQSYNWNGYYITANIQLSH